ncbi:DUF423 domain-containing protein [Undibacterium seohonense]|jgi:uncharacterized membrane protein YgdD (TMEM256/DUF423 family)|uniref:DUF423 domain-containing protein n=1 Tax=Undibacterium seohonense TaxID=1344950 RepID=A0ABR6X7K6_9BURK|nr:DUF423 domain-containing protein [Undibacterium seohonense]MBC3808304.1 DUF423 domain-containing protein [Undibacterium seohonense]
MNERHLIACAAINLLIAIAAGAFGAHALKNFLSTEMLSVWQTAVQYQMLHGLALLALANLLPRWDAKKIRWSAISMLLGIVLFSGSLYLLAASGIRVLGAITPLGGLAFLFGWANLAWAALAEKST